MALVKIFNKILEIEKLKNIVPKILKIGFGKVFTLL